MEFVGPALEALRSEYQVAHMKLCVDDPTATDKMIKLAVAQRVINAVEGHIKAAMADGAFAMSEKARADEIAKLPEAKRRWI
ncbi:hypothetical protein [Sphingobium sp. YR768]|uniref:hypothetical protein n=1 Tax=Sphingobium sp. YR768 TaxID=1884365 RepID=UPI000B82A048|nr:hypothetical protein [Sphingobium sp. YR768]